MQECSYPEYEHHRKLHKKFLKQVLEMEGGHNQGSPNGNLDLVNFLRDWIIHHILTADRKYGPFFNEKGIF
jgi:hemerythrin